LPADGELLKAWRGGNRAAGEELFERHAERVLRFFRNKVDADVDDLIQQTFLGALESCDRFEGRSSFRAFLLGIANNVLCNHFRRRRARGQNFDVDRDAVVDVTPGPSSMLVHRSEEQLLLQGLRTLPLVSQVVLELFYWEDMTASEIAEVLEHPEGTIRTRIRTARRLLSERVEALCHGDRALRDTATDLERWAASIRASLPGNAR
jgi:RNA polymerase sigma factor (sigma-70 family)